MRGYRFAEVTGRSAQQFFQLLCRFGLDRLLDESQASARREIETGTPQGLSGPAAGEAPSADDEVETDAGADAENVEEAVEAMLSIDLGQIVRECATEGALGELAELAIAEAPEGKEPIDAPAAVLREAVRDFGQESFALIGGVLSFAAS